MTLKLNNNIKILYVVYPYQSKTRIDLQQLTHYAKQTKLYLYMII